MRVNDIDEVWYRTSTTLKPTYSLHRQPRPQTLSKNTYVWAKIRRSCRLSAVKTQYLSIPPTSHWTPETTHFSILGFSPQQILPSPCNITTIFFQFHLTQAQHFNVSLAQPPVKTPNCVSLFTMDDLQSSFSLACQHAACFFLPSPPTSPLPNWLR